MMNGPRWHLVARWYLAAGILLFAGWAIAAGCSEGTREGEVAMAPVKELPVAVRRAPANVREAYQFAVANPDLLQQVPCYCGCRGMGHTSNYSCFVGVTESGERSFDNHALGCSICVDIALDVRRLLKQGQGTPDIRSYIDVVYSKYGPSNML